MGLTHIGNVDDIRSSESPLNEAGPQRYWLFDFNAYIGGDEDIRYVFSSMFDWSSRWSFKPEKQPAYASMRFIVVAKGEPKPESIRRWEEEFPEMTYREVSFKDYSMLGRTRRRVEDFEHVGNIHESPLDPRRPSKTWVTGIASGHLSPGMKRDLSVRLSRLSDRLYSSPMQGYKRLVQMLLDTHNIMIADEASDPGYQIIPDYFRDEAASDLRFLLAFAGDDDDDDYDEFAGDARLISNATLTVDYGDVVRGGGNYNMTFRLTP